MASKVGTLIREARTDAGYTQEQLARKIKGLSADDISKAERGEKELTQTILKEIAKATGVTQKSLIDAAKGASSAKNTASKTSSSKKTASKTSSSKKTDSKTSSSKKTDSKTSSSKKTASGTSSSKKSTSSAFKVSAQEKKLINAYREADEKMKSAVNLILLGADSLSTESGAGDMLSALLNGVKDLFAK